MESSPTSSSETLLKISRGLVYLVYAFVIVALVILTFGFFLLLFGANPDAGFTEWVYNALDKVMKPFRGIFEPVNFNGESVLDTSVMFAMIVYGIAGLALRSLIDWLTYRVMLTHEQSQALQSYGLQTVTAGGAYGQPPAQAPPVTAPPVPGQPGPPPS
jgi:uncharacterized protein YggT (Ycf19 family)